MRTAARLCLLLAVGLLAAGGCDSGQGTLNHEPDPPGIRGPEQASPQISYLFRARAADADGDSLSFRFDWGGGNLSSWSAPIPEDSFVLIARTWSDTGRYLVRAQARDEHLSTSRWSEPTAVVVERERPVAPDFSLPDG